MAREQYLVTLTGETPLLMHADSIDWADEISAWSKDSANKKHSVAGDDRAPAWKWLGSLYVLDGVVVLPLDNVMAVLLEGGALVPVPKAKGSKTFKSQTQSGIFMDELAWPLFAAGKSVEVESLFALKGEKDFSKHRAAAIANGFELFVKRARVGTSKHVRVRPLFRRWSASGVLSVTDEQITMAVLSDILTLGGSQKGLGDWRPGAPKRPGPYGTFTATVERV